MRSNRQRKWQRGTSGPTQRTSGTAGDTTAMSRPPSECWENSTPPLAAPGYTALSHNLLANGFPRAGTSADTH
eukprot:159941-Heterocapsa_arctica.AAC.1